MILKFLFLLAAFPLGVIAARYTRDEKSLYSLKRYFPTVLVIAALGMFAFILIDSTVAFTFAFLFLLVLTWSKR